MARLRDAAAPLALLVAGCPAGTTQVPAAGPPRVTAIYAVDSTQGNLSDVALYSADSRTSARAPASYGGLRVVFDQPMQGPTLASLPALNGGTACGPSASVLLIDVDQGGASLPASVCYDPTSPIGGGPSVTILPGADLSPAKVFTCQRFNGAPSLMPNHTYAIKLLAANILGDNGKPLVPPAAAGWTGSTFTFQTGDLELLAAGYQDQVNGFFHFIAKPSVGYLKDLDPEPAAVYRQQLFAPFLIIASDTLAIVSPDDPRPVTSDATPAVTVVRTKDGSSFPVAVTATGLGDQRVIQVAPAVTWEPNVDYTATLQPTLLGTRGSTIGGAPRSYQFTADSPPKNAISSVPRDKSVAQPSNAAILLILQSPADPNTVNVTNIQLTQGGAAVTAKIFLVPATNGQIVFLKPTARLKPATLYTVTAANLQTAAVPQEDAGQTFPPSKATFRTATFRLAKITAAGSDNGPDIDRAQGLPPSLVADGSLTAVFNDLPAGVGAESLKLSEVAPAGGTKDTGAAVMQLSSQIAFTLTTPAGYALKFGQTYEVRAAPSIKDPNSVLLSRESCATSDCSDARTFTTDVLAPSVGKPDPVSGAFAVKFNFAVDATSLNAQIPNNETGKAIRLSRVDDKGNLVQVPITCQPASGPSATQVQCAPGGKLDANTSYVITVTFAVDTPLRVATPLVVGGVAYPVDPASGVFAGTVTATFLSACP